MILVRAPANLNADIATSFIKQPGFECAGNLKAEIIFISGSLDETPFTACLVGRESGMIKRKGALCSKYNFEIVARLAENEKFESESAGLW